MVLLFFTTENTNISVLLRYKFLNFLAKWFYFKVYASCITLLKKARRFIKYLYILLKKYKGYLQFFTVSNDDFSFGLATVCTMNQFSWRDPYLKSAKYQLRILNNLYIILYFIFLYPSTTSPKTVYFPSKQLVATVVMKNWEMLVLVPALVIDNNPGLVCLVLKFSSSNFSPKKLLIYFDEYDAQGV